MSWFIVITEEMRNWGLTGNELLVFALINGYSQQEQGCYWGSIERTAEITGTSRRTAMRTLQSLIEKKLIKKDKAVISGEFKIIYSVTTVSKWNTQCQIDLEECQNDLQGGDKMTPYNKDYKKDIRKIERDNKSRFQKPSVEEVRQYCAARANGIDPEEFVAFYESKGWLIGKAPMKDWRAAVITWEKSQAKRGTPSSKKEPTRKMTAVESGLKTLDALGGTHYWEHYYGQKKDTPDEQ